MSYTLRRFKGVIVMKIKQMAIGEIYSKLLDFTWNKIMYPYYKTAFYEIGKDVRISRKATIKCAKNIVLGNNASIGEYAILNGDSEKYNPSITIGDNTYLTSFAVIDAQGGFVKIGENCSVNPFCILYGHGGLEIGNGVRIAAKTTIIPANHRFDRIDIPQYKQSLIKKGIKIYDDVWIGTNVTILDGVRIHRGSVVGGGAVVTKDIPAYSVAVGVPAKVIKRRIEGKT